MPPCFCYAQDESKSVAITTKSVTIKEKPVDGEGPSLTVIGKINVDKYKCVTKNITADEVIITDERIDHINKRHPGDYEIIEPYLQEVLDEPDYILKDEKQCNTGLVLKQVFRDGLRVQVVLRLHTTSDVQDYKNSILSAWRISESRWNNYLKNRKILYKRR